MPQDTLSLIVIIVVIVLTVTLHHFYPLTYKKFWCFYGKTWFLISLVLGSSGKLVAYYMIDELCLQGFDATSYTVECFTSLKGFFLFYKDKTWVNTKCTGEIITSCNASMWKSNYALNPINIFSPTNFLKFYVCQLLTIFIYPYHWRIQALILFQFVAWLSNIELKDQHPIHGFIINCKSRSWAKNIWLLVRRIPLSLLQNQQI